jgi:hypothetical protein
VATADRPEQPEPASVVRLHHGTDVGSANDILHNGLSQVSAGVFNVTGEFWTTTDAASADTFAQVNPAGGVPARYSFDLPLRVLQAVLSSHPPGAYQHGADWFEFLPPSYPVLNRHMVNRQVVSPVP